MRIAILAAAVAIAATLPGGIEQARQPVIAGIKTDKQRYGLAEPVKIAFAIENRSDRPVTYNFASGKQFDIWVVQNEKEVWRWSLGRAFTQALTSITLAPGERRTFDVEWNQKDTKGEQVPPGVYQIWGQLTAVSDSPAPVSTRITLGGGPVVITTTVSGVVSRLNALIGKQVSIDATYRGFRADPESPACKPGPPVTRSDWAIQDKTGCIFVTGQTTLDPVNDIGKPVRVLGVVRKTDKGQPYLELRSVTILKR